MYSADTPHKGSNKSSLLHAIRKRCQKREEITVSRPSSFASPLRLAFDLDVP